MKQQDPLYFIAIIPPTPIREEGLQLKEYFRDQYNSKASLNSPPHITLHMPFRFKEKKEDKLMEVLESFAGRHENFQVELEDFGAFGPRVIFIDVALNQALENLQKDLVKTARQGLNLHNANYKQRGFHPHITLAFRDLRKPAFKEAWIEFKPKEYHATFEVSSFWLLKHNGKNWEEYREFEFC